MHFNLINRYLARELISSFLAIVTVLLLIAISHKFVRLITKAAIGQISPAILGEFVVMHVPDLLAILLPISLFLAILLSFGKLYSNREIPVMLVLGLNWAKLIKFILCFGLFVALIVGSITIFLAPYIAKKREALVYDQGPLLLVQTVSEGRFHSFAQDKLVFYVENLSNDRRQLEKIFIAEKPQADKTLSQPWSLLIAKNGTIEQNLELNKTILNLEQGTRYTGIPGAADYSVISFDLYRKILQQNKPVEDLYYHRTMPTKMLLDSPNPSRSAEFHWRIALPISALVLSLLALSMAKVEPRKGRFSKLFIGIIAMIVYFNLLSIGKRLIKEQIIPSELGLWWVHIAVLAIAIILLLVSSRQLLRFNKLCKK